MERGQLNCSHSVLQSRGYLGHLLSAIQLHPSCRPPRRLGGQPNSSCLSRCCDPVPCSLEGRGVARLISAQGANGALSYSYLCSWVHRAAHNGQPVMPTRAGAESRQGEPSQWKRGCRQVSQGLDTCAHRSLWARRVGAPGVLFTDSPANTALSLHPPKPNRFHLLTGNLVMGDLLKD